MFRRFPIVEALLVVASYLPVYGLAKAPESAAGGSSAHVAGLVPHQRPQGAPAIREFVRTAEWRTRALTGISEPLPASLGFLKQQGAWHTPFIDPGMPGYYDLRGWHRESGGAEKQGR